MIKELLQLFICIIDAELFKAIQFEDLKASNIQDTYETKKGTLKIGTRYF